MTWFYFFQKEYCNVVSTEQNLGCLILLYHKAINEIQEFEYGQYLLLEVAQAMHALFIIEVIRTAGSFWEVTNLWFMFFDDMYVDIEIEPK